MSIVLVTGAAGFIGFHLAKQLLKKGFNVIGIDNMNDYYDVNLKKSRLEQLYKNKMFKFHKVDIANYDNLKDIFEDYKFDYVFNLAAQAGVRYSKENPHSYIHSNILGFTNILECCRHFGIKHLFYASSSSVYGGNTKVPFNENDKCSTPLSLYAATKMSNELMAYSYCHMYNMKTTGFRFFTVYGTYGRPDMAYFSFTNKMFNDTEIEVYNNGEMSRDFTYVDDVVEAITILFDKELNGEIAEKCSIYNIGNNNPVNLMKFIKILESNIGKNAKIKMQEMQLGDVVETYACVDKLEDKLEFKPKTSLEQGLKKFVEWYKKYYLEGNHED